jgi:hypothetical protein
MEVKNLIIITGCPRSGTSMVAGSINKCGAFGGKMNGPNRNNKKGMFENHKIISSMVKPFLKKLNVDPMGQYPLPKTDSLQTPHYWKSSFLKVFKEEGFRKGSIMYKDPKIGLLWPIWYDCFPEAKWVIVRRKTDDIVDSCLKTGFMRAFHHSFIQKEVGVMSEAEGWEWWVNQHLGRFEAMKEKIQFKEIWPEKMVYGDYSELMATIKWLGLEWNSDVLSFIDPMLWKSRQKI